MTAVTQGKGAGAMDATADKAAASFVKWVAARNAALGETVLAGALAASIQAQTRQGLLDISALSARSVKKDKPAKNADAARNLDSRLRWKSWSGL